MEYKKKLYIAPKINAIVVVLESNLLQASQEFDTKDLVEENIDNVI